MRDTLLFGYLPYVTLALLVLAPLCHALVPSPAIRPPARRTGLAWRYGIGLVLAGHLAGFLLPGQAAALRRMPGGAVVVVEAAAFGAGVLALAGLVAFVGAAFAPGRPGRAEPGSLADTLFWTLLAIAVISGLAMALVYRWGSSWLTVTIVPYLRSLLRLQPEVQLVAEMPPLVRLHVLAGIAAGAVLPFTRWGAIPGRLASRLRGRPWRVPRPAPPSTSLR
jgi:nitrate reductase gamma subunit